MMTITTKMNVTDSTESTDTMTVINNEQSIIDIVIVYFLKFVKHYINSGTKTLDYNGNKLQCPQQLLLNKK